jgi:murein DD-endopeptidase MepM/ murein hydrolase activator NlpD
VRSATQGYVVRLGENALGGRVVLIAGAGGRRYYYAHLEAFAADLRVGRYVTPETLIGFVGTTGNAARTPPHLHFAVYTVVGAVNPLPMLQDRMPSSSSGCHHRGHHLRDISAHGRSWRRVWMTGTGAVAVF